MPYQHLRVFGCLTYMHVGKDHSSRLDNKSKPCICLGYSEDEFEYKMWDLLDKKMVRSHDVVFMEEWTTEELRKQKRVSSS